jgi:hypothetical protein
MKLNKKFSDEDHSRFSYWGNFILIGIIVAFAIPLLTKQIDNKTADRFTATDAMAQYEVYSQDLETRFDEHELLHGHPGLSANLKEEEKRIAELEQEVIELKRRIAELEENN